MLRAQRFFEASLTGALHARDVRGMPKVQLVFPEDRMRPIARLLALPLVVCIGTQPAWSAEAGKPVIAVIETTLPTAGKQIRQFAFDGDSDSYFASAANAKKDDEFGVVLDRPVAIKSITVTTGKPGGEERFAGVLEGSNDGKTFERLSAFENGIARVRFDGRMLRAVRLKSMADAVHPLVVREIVIDSEPAVATFRYPIEIVVDAADAPELKDWAEKVARVCERQYPMICDELASEGYKPRTLISMALKNDYKGVAAAGGGRITGSVAYFAKHQDDVGAMVHETVHCVQNYRTRNNPGWLVEGIADYIRFFKYEPGKLGKINAQRARYDGSYRVSAAFLAYVTQKYDKGLVLKLNKAMREGEYKESIWQALTKKTLQELGDEWRATLQTGAVSGRQEG